MRAVLELDYTRRGGRVETHVVHSEDDTPGAHVNGCFIPFIKTQTGWAFVHGVAYLELTQPDVWVEGEMLGATIRARLLSE